MIDRLFVDTNVLIYAMDQREPAKRKISAEVIRRSFAGQKLVVSPQILNECYRALVHKRKLVSATEARGYLRAFFPVCIAPLTSETHDMAYHIEDRHRFSWWDCLAIASALQARCRIFISEDLQDGRDVEGMALVDPFGPNARSALEQI